jgi:hypothetical protein
VQKQLLNIWRWMAASMIKPDDLMAAGVHREKDRPRWGEV